MAIDNFLKTHYHKIIYVFLPLLLLIFHAICQLCVGFAQFDINEQHYLAALHFASTGAMPWTDYPYLQLPLMPWLFTLVSHLFSLPTSGQSLFLAAKISIALASTTTCWLLWRMAFQLSKSSALALFILALAIISHSLVRIGWEIAPNALALALWLAGMHLLLYVPQRALQYAFAAGLFFALAITAKVYHVYALPAVLLYLIISQLSSRKWLLGLAGFIIGMLPLAFTWWQQPQLAWWYTAQFHLDFSEYYTTQFPLQSLWFKFSFLVGSHLSRIAHLVVIPLSAALLWHYRKGGIPAAFWLILATLLCNLVGILSMRVIFGQYLSLLTPFILLLPAALWRPSASTWLRGRLTLALHLFALALVLKHGVWVIKQRHAAFQRYHDMVTHSHTLPAGTLVATLHPGTALMLGGSIHPALVGSVFTWASSKHAPQHMPADLPVFTIKQMKEWLKTQHPPAVIISPEDDPLAQQILLTYSLDTGLQEKNLVDPLSQQNIRLFTKPH